MSTTPQGESEHSSSLNNVSRKAVKGMEEEFDESSIEALNWSEADEEEMQLERKRKLSPVQKSGGNEVEEIAAASMSMEQSTGSEGTVRKLSSSLLQSINSEDSINTKNQVIESWASEVKEAVERGEMEYQEEDEEDETVEEEDKENLDARSGIRKRKRMSKEDLVTSILSNTTTESGGDQMSNVPVLDDGPIWKKGPKRYRFEENRRINQKLTFGVLIAVVLAIGLGLGNLVAYNECESEYKATLANQKVDSVPSAAEQVKTQQQSFPQQPAPEVAKSKIELPKTVTDIPSTLNAKPLQEQQQPKPKSTKPDIEIDKEQYTMQMETLSKIVKTLDNLQRKIDNFENTSRQLGGVVMLKEPVEDVTTTTPSSHIWDEDDASVLVEDGDSGLTEEELKEEEEAFVMDLIDGIEETTNYLLRQDELEYIEELEKRIPESHRSQLFADKSEKPSKELDDILTIEAVVTILKKAHEDFILRERDELRERKILGLAEEREPEDYSKEEKEELRRKYDKFMEQYPFKEEVEVAKERLKFARRPREDDILSDDIDGFFKRYESYEDSSEELDFRDFLYSSSSSGDNEKFNVIPEPKKDVTVSSPTKETAPTIEGANNEKQDKSSKTPERDSGEGKMKKSKKHKKKKEYAQDGNGEDSSGGRSKKDKKKNSNKENYDEKWGGKKNKKYNEKPHKDSFNMNNNFIDPDDDDDDQKRKKHHRSGEDYNNGQYTKNGYKKAPDNTNWLLERTKAREEIRKDYSSKLRSQQNQHSSNGRKASNWQLERDRVRAKSRSKNEREKSFDL